ncbi:hypothetical protein AAZX31_14G023600 [Glycine max]|nr:hypothetical protein JHK85_039365 [Glycine max]
MSNELKNYDVFLNFHGKDSGYTFTGTLYNALRSKRIKTFFTKHEYGRKLHTDDSHIPPFTLKAIKESRISVVVLSENYASSSRCLDELVAILECKRTINQLVWPIFYKVDPSQVRHQKGSYGEHICNLKKNFRDYNDSNERVKQWRAALSEVSKLSGWLYNDRRSQYEYEFIERIVESTVQALPGYDVFLSFTGEDTRYTFTGFLYNAFRREGFKIFMDDEELESGNQISQKLMRAIESSKISIVVLSENYAYSTWCLDELAKIIECMKTNNQMVWPIFYNVQKSDVCNQTKSYGEAMTEHEKRFGKDSEKVQKWRSALSEIKNLEGDHVKQNEYQHELIERIVEKVIKIEGSKHTANPFLLSNDSYEEE